MVDDGFLELLDVEADEGDVGDLGEEFAIRQRPGRASFLRRLMGQGDGGGVEIQVSIPFII
jgi:hypothetical protein